MNRDAQQWIVWWVIWAAFFSGIFMMYFFFEAARGEQSPAGDSALRIASLAPLVASAVIRWLVLPRLRNVQVAFALFIVGMALAEASLFVGLFVYPQEQLQFLAVTAIGIGQFIPFFAGRYFSEPTRNRYPGLDSGAPGR